MQLVRTFVIMSDLADFLAKRRKQSSYRKLQDFTGVSRSALEDIIKRTGGLPEIATLQKLAAAYKKPLWEIAQMAGIDLELPKTPTERVQRLEVLVSQVPRFERTVLRLKKLYDTDPDYVDGMLIFLEATIDQRLGPPTPGE